MTENFIAIAVKGKEFLYKRSSMIAVPRSSAFKIAELLNSQNYMIKEGEVWHVFEACWEDKYYIGKTIRSFRKGRVIIHSQYAG